MWCSHQCKPKSKASFSFADLVSFVFSLFSICPLKPSVFRGLRKQETLCKFADSMPEKYRITHSETKGNTRFQVWQRSCDLRIAHWWSEDLQKYCPCSRDGTQNFQEGRLWLHQSLPSATAPYPKASV